MTGLLLYMFRCRYLKIYGWLEVGVGVATGLYLANTLNNPQGSSFGPYFAVIASLYVIVRGLDNLHKSLKNERYIALWNRFFYGIKPGEEGP
jgi:hypothetical protein